MGYYYFFYYYYLFYFFVFIIILFKTFCAYPQTGQNNLFIYLYVCFIHSFIHPNLACVLDRQMQMLRRAPLSVLLISDHVA